MLLYVPVVNSFYFLVVFHNADVAQFILLSVEHLGSIIIWINLSHLVGLCVWAVNSISFIFGSIIKKNVLKQHTWKFHGFVSCSKNIWMKAGHGGTYL
jgi:hypothetical protein